MSLMAAEIGEQPDALGRLLDTQDRAAVRLGACLRSDPPRGVLFAARGSSDHAAQYGRYLFELSTGAPCALAAPSLVTVLGRPLRLSGWLAVGISQSGQGPDVVAVLRRARRSGALCLAITNDAGSPLALAAHHCLELSTGPERAVAATKTYTASLAALALAAAHWSRDRALLRGLRGVPRRMSRALAGARAAGEETARRLGDARDLAVLGRGPEYASALELALKLKECARVQAHAYSTADFVHGPAALVAKGFPVVAFRARGAYAAGGAAALGSLRRRGADVRVLSAPPSADWRLSPVLSIVPGQWLALSMALQRGFDPDRPPGLRKVTRTW